MVIVWCIVCTDCFHKSPFTGCFAWHTATHWRLTGDCDIEAMARVAPGGSYMATPSPGDPAYCHPGRHWLSSLRPLSRLTQTRWLNNISGWTAGWLSWSLIRAVYSCALWNTGPIIPQVGGRSISHRHAAVPASWHSIMWALCNVHWDKTSILHHRKVPRHDGVSPLIVSISSWSWWLVVEWIFNLDI